MVVRSVETLNRLAPAMLRDLWAKFRVDYKLPEDMTITVFHVGLADDDGWVIGRILGDSHAREGVTRVYDSLLKSTANRAAVFPKCGLPFRGVTDWSTRGVELPVDGGGKRWLIHELLRCSAPFSFDELEVVRDNDGTQADPDTDLPEDEKRPAWSPPRRKAKLGEDAHIQSDDPQEAQIDPIDIPLAGERPHRLQRVCR